MELSLVINLTKDDNWAVTRPPIFATGYVSFATTFLYQVASTCYQQNKLISNTEKYSIKVKGYHISSVIRHLDSLFQLYCHLVITSITIWSKSS